MFKLNYINPNYKQKMKNIFILFFLTLIIFLFAHEEHEPHYKEGKHNPDHPHSESEIEEHRKDFNTYDLNQV